MYKYVQDESNFYDLALDLSEGNIKEVFADLETTGLDARLSKILLFQVMAGDNIYIFDLLKLNNEHLKYLVNLLENVAKVTSVFHNTKFDITFLYHNTGIWMKRIYDTMNAEVLINAGIGKSTYNLEELALKYAGVQLNKKVREEFFNKEITVMSEQMLQYSAEDVMVLKPIYEAQMEQIIKAKEEKILEIEMEVLPVIANMEYNGVLIDEGEWLKIAEREEERLVGIDANLKELFLNEIHVENYADAYELAKAISYPMSNLSKKKETALKQLTTPDVLIGWFRQNFNIGSTYQLQACLKLAGVETNTTNKKILQKLDKNPIIDEMLEKSECAKRVSTYGRNVITYFHPITGRIHTQFLDMGTVSGRLSSGSPMNLQNIPRKNGYRECFISAPDFSWISCDYSQQEFRLTGAISNEQKIIDAYIQGADMHTATASIIYHKPLYEINKDERYIGKTANFTIVYGGTEYALGKNLGLSQAQSEEILNSFKTGYPTLNKFKEASEEAILKYGFSSTVLGRRRYNEKMPTYMTNNEYLRYVNKQKREGFNHIIQGCLPPDTNILTNNGWKHIVDFDENNEKVWTGESWATATLLNRGEDTRVRLYLNDGRTFDCDTRHKLLVNDAVYPRWATIDEIVGLPLVRDTCVDFGNPDEFSVEDWYWYGRMIGDGSINKSQWTLAFGHNEQKEIDNFERWISTKNFKGNTNSKKGWNKNTDRRGNVQFSGATKVGKAFWGSMGYEGKSRTKRLNPKIFTLDYERRLAVFKGYFDADGHHRDRSEKITSVNYNLLLDTLKLLQTLGRTGKIGSKNIHKGNNVEWYDLQIHKEAHKLCVERIEILNKETMFTLSVNDERHSFSTEGIISKNTAADVTKIAMIKIWQNNPFGEKLKMLIQVHDELNFEAHNSISKDAGEFVREEMIKVEQPFLKDIPAAADLSPITNHWVH